MTAIRIACSECRHENEPERLYCHNCGARLDRSGATQEKTAHDPRESHRRLQKMLAPPNQFRRNFFNVSKLVLAAAAVAAVVQIALPPDVPAPSKALPSQIDLELENVASHRRPGPLEYTQDQINAYLAYRLAGKKKALDKPYLSFKSATVLLQEETCAIAIERSLFGYSLFSRASYRVEAGRGKIAALNNGAWLGRLPVHPAIMKFGDIIFADLWSALDRERKLIAKVGSITVHDGSVTIAAP